MSNVRRGYVCLSRPNRSRARLYSAKDVGRIYCKAIEQGVARSDIEREIAEKCPPDRTGECTCAQLLAELKQYLEMAAYALEIIAMVIPIARVLRLAILAARKLNDLRLESDAEAAAKQLEDLSSQKPIIEGEYQRIDTLSDEIARMIGEVIIR